MGTSPLDLGTSGEKGVIIMADIFDYMKKKPIKGIKSKVQYTKIKEK